MWQQFYLENLDFAINIFTAFVFFSAFWLYFDAWFEKKKEVELIKIFGFFLLFVSHLFFAVAIESPIIETFIFGKNLFPLLARAIKLLGYLFIVLGLLAEPTQKHPKHVEGESKASSFLIIPAGLGIFDLLNIFQPLGSFLVGLLYLRRVAIGLERHQRRVSLAFLIMSLSDLIYLTDLLKNVKNINVLNLVSPYGTLWIIQRVILFIAAFILGVWVWSYLLKRLFTQLFMVLTTISLSVFLITTVSFTALLLKNMQDEAMNQMDIDVKVLNYAIDSKKQEVLSDAIVVSQNLVVKDAIKEGKTNELAKLLEDHLLTKKESMLVVVSDSGKVLGRGEDVERIGDSLSDDPLVKRSLLGESVNSVATHDAVLAPEISIRASVPIKGDEDKIIGAVLTGVKIDNTFVDGVRTTTGLEASIYGDNILSATTIVSFDGKTRPIGAREENKDIKDKVLKRGEEYLGTVIVFGVPNFAAYFPLKDMDNVVVGMLFVGKPQITVLQAVGSAIEYSFMIAVCLIVLFIIPSYLVSKHIVKQFR